MTNTHGFHQPIAEQIWSKKYQWKSFEGEEYDKCVEDTWHRIAEALSEDIYQHAQFYSALKDFKFLPAGRITAGAGTGRKVTLSNCFTMGTIEDDLASIYDHLKEAALTMKQGGGIGYDFSTLRPSGAHVKGVDADASGPLTFMDNWDSMCRTIMSAGSRRGAMMATMRVDHPDIEQFIEAKRDPLRLRMFNMSVLVTDDFMEAVRKNDSFDLKFNGEVYRTVQASVLWDKIMMSTYAYAEPGVLFIDRINNMHNLNYIETVATTNPCGEKPMGPYASCLLGSINLAKFVLNPFTEEATINQGALCDTVVAAITMMDRVIETSNFPLEAQKEKALADRQLGLGVTGLADAMVMMNITYGSDYSCKFVEEIMECINDTAYWTSVDLAKKLGPFPNFNADAFLASGFMENRNEKLREAISKYGIRNALITSVAPTGTISIYAGNVSSGIEPIFAKSYERKILNDDGSHTTEVVKDYAVWLWEGMYGKKPLSKHFVTANDLTPQDHVNVQAAAQKHVDSSISKTINVPEDISFDDFKQVYMSAYVLGCKGCTTYRPNDVTGSVLTSLDEKESTVEDEGGACFYDPETGTKSCDNM